MADTPLDHAVIAGLQERIKAFAPARLGAHGFVPDHASPGLDGRQALCPRAMDQRWHHPLAAYPLLEAADLDALEARAIRA